MSHHRMSDSDRVSNYMPEKKEKHNWYIYWYNVGTWLVGPPPPPSNTSVLYNCKPVFFLATTFPIVPLLLLNHGLFNAFPFFFLWLVSQQSQQSQLLQEKVEGNLKEGQRKAKGKQEGKAEGWIGKESSRKARRKGCFIIFIHVDSHSISVLVCVEIKSFSPRK